MKYITYFVAFIICCFASAAMDSTQTKTEMAIHLQGKRGTIDFRTLTNNDIQDIVTMEKNCTFKEGIPSNPQNWAENLVQRQSLGNSYSALVLFQDKVPLGVLGFGRMPVLNYDPKHIDIIDTYVELGVTAFKDASAQEKYVKENIVRVENKGLATLLPMLPETLGDAQRLEALKIGVEAVRYLRNSTKLPLEGTTPEYLIGLFHPNDSLLPLLQEAGFKIIAKKGFFGFYDKDRVMACLKLS